MKFPIRISRVTLLTASLLLYFIAVPSLLHVHAQHQDGNGGSCAVCFIGQHFQLDTPEDQSLDIQIEEHLLDDIQVRTRCHPARIFHDALGRAPPRV